MTNLENHSDAAALVGRLFFSSMFLVFGFNKLTGYTGTVGYMGSLGLPAPALFTFLAIIIEIGGGLLILVGYQTRLVSLGLAFTATVETSRGRSRAVDRSAYRPSFRKFADSPVEEGVSSEPVSEPKFPASWENTGNFIGSGLISAKATAKMPMAS